jgi:hypothetical protein
MSMCDFFGSTMCLGSGCAATVTDECDTIVNSAMTVCKITCLAGSAADAGAAL